MRIGEVAAQTGVHVQTIRFYERRGLLHKPRRLPSGYRDYPAETVRVVRWIKQFQEHGFTLKEIGGLLRSLTAQAEAELCAQVETKLQHVEAELLALQTTRDKLRALRRRLEDSSGPAVLNGNEFDTATTKLLRE